MKINKDTALYGSFSHNPGNQGCKRFNHAFEINEVDAIYKSFKVDNIKDVFTAATILKIQGFALSSPFKKQAVEYCKTGGDKNINTVIRKDFGDDYSFDYKWWGQNTDYFGIKEYYLETESDPFRKDQSVYIVGMGAFAQTAAYVFREFGKDVFFVSSRYPFPKGIRDALVFNAAPVTFRVGDIHSSCDYIDADPLCSSGKRMSFLTARHQFYDVYGFPKDYKFEEVA